MTWSAQGNLTSDSVRSYTYDAANRLLTGGGSSLTYDPLDRLYEMTGTGAGRFQYDGSQLAGAFNGAGGMFEHWVGGPGPDEWLTFHDGAQWFWPLQNAQGSVVALTDPSGAATATLAYDEYGQPRSGNAGRMQYTGQMMLPDMGLQYYKARAYYAGLGRFVQTDPVGYQAGLNLYAYVRGDPVNNTDPTGKCPPAIPCGDFVIGVIHGLGGTVQATANVDAVPGGYAGPAGAAIPGGVVSAGVYVGRGPEGDLRVGASLTGGVAVGADVSGGAQVTAYAGDTSNVRGAAHQGQVQASAGGSVSVTAGTTSRSATQPGGGVPFVGVSVGVAPPGPAGHIAATQTAAGDIRVLMSPTAKVVSIVTETAKNYVKDRILDIFQ